jgi:hypothetical protein
MERFSSRYALGMTFYFLACVSSASGQQPAVGNLGHCIQWRFSNNLFVAKNICNQTVVVHFMFVADERVLRWTLRQGDSVNTGFALPLIKFNRWITATCPEGYVTDPAFRADNRAELDAGHYSCAPQS